MYQLGTVELAQLAFQLPHLISSKLKNTCEQTSSQLPPPSPARKPPSVFWKLMQKLCKSVGVSGSYFAQDTPSELSAITPSQLEEARTCTPLVSKPIIRKIFPCIFRRRRPSGPALDVPAEHKDIRDVPLEPLQSLPHALPSSLKDEPKNKNDKIAERQDVETQESTGGQSSHSSECSQRSNSGSKPGSNLTAGCSSRTRSSPNWTVYPRSQSGSSCMVKTPPRVVEKASSKRYGTGSSNLTIMDRRDFATIRGISNMDLRHLLISVVSSSLERPVLEQVQIDARIEGGYHHVVFMEYNHDDRLEEFVVRIPAHGIADRWTDEDEYMLRNEAELMKHIWRQTKVPTPEVINYCETLDNKIGAPYIIMRTLAGKSAYSIWFDDFDGPSAHDKYRLNADHPSEETRKKRCTFLYSLAGNMAELATLEFDKIGMPKCDSRTPDAVPEVGPSYHWTSSTDTKKSTMRGPFSSTQGYITSALNDGWDPETAFSDDIDRCRGFRKMLDIIYSTPAFSPCEAPPNQPETFVLHHNDLDLQNILVDDEGNVTGILDWDNCTAGPRCIGPAAVPRFLRNDWYPNFTIERPPYIASANLEFYRNVYAGAMWDTGCKDAKYTSKSAMYQAAIAAIYGGGDIADFIVKVSDRISGLQGVNLDEFHECLGRGWPAAETGLKEEIEQLFSAEEP